MRIRSLPGASFSAAIMLGLPFIIGHIPTASADPTINAEPTYCTGTNLGPESGPRRDGKDTVQASADFTCDQAQFVETIFTISGDGHSWTDDVAAQVPQLPRECTPSAPCGRTIDSLIHKVGGDLNGQTYTVTVTVKIWTSSTIFCGGNPANCYPFGTPLRTFELPPVTQAVYD
jgi:hypothetical protein